MTVIIPTTTTSSATKILVSALLLLFIPPTTLAFIGTPTTSFYLSQHTPSTTTTTKKSISTSFQPKQQHRRIISSSFITLTALKSTTTEESDHKNKEQILSDIIELTSSFEEVQQTIQTNTVLYEERLDEYDTTIQSLQTIISKAEKDLLRKDETLNSTNLEVEEGVMEKAALVARLEELEVEVREGKFALEGKGREITMMEQRRLALVEEVKNAEEDAKKADEVAKKVEEEEVKKVEEEEAKKVEEEEAKKAEVELAAVEVESQSDKVNNDYVKQIQLLEKEASSTKNASQEKDTTIATLQTNLSKQQRSASAATATSTALTARLETMKQEATEMTNKLASKTSALATVEQSLSGAMIKEQQLVERIDSNSDTIIDGLETLLRRKDESIAKLTITVREVEEQLQPGAGRDIQEERDGLRLERDGLVEELNLVTERVKMQARKDIVEVMSKAKNEQFELQSRMDMSLEEKGERISILEMEIEAYKLERYSLRQLARLGFARCVSVFNEAYE